ncbi:MAG: membrane protein insertase YidC [Steroidobacteraceae bacterium]
MKHLRTILWASLALAAMLNFQMWMRDYGPRDAAAAAAAAKVAESEKVTNPLAANVPMAAVPAAQPAPGAAPATTAATPPPVAGDVPVVTAPAVAATPQTSAAAGTILNVRTDVLDVDVNVRGGELQRADLLNYPVVKGQPAPVRLLRNHGTGDQYLLQTGLAGAGSVAPAESFPTHLANYTSEYAGFRMDSSIDELRVPLKWTSPEGVEVTKTLIFKRGSYRIDVEYAIKNPTAAPWSVAAYAQILHDRPAIKRSYFNVDSYSFTGPAYWDGTKYDKLKITSKEDAGLNRDVAGGWLASLEHHFVVAVAPARDETHHFSLRVRGDEYLETDVGPAVTIAAGSSGLIKQTLFIGPKLQAQLEPIHPELGRAADFGILTFLSRPLFWLLEQAHKIFGNWGMAIIAITFLLKLVFYPLSEASGRSMAKMKLVAPRLKQLQETYKDDRAKLGSATMELYKKEKINPASGCLPMLIQMPVFLAFYWILLESVEMRQAPFFGWIQDLSVRDPFYILPLIMAAAMFLQYKLSPTPADPIQAKVMMIMPLVMSVTFAFFPAGLVLYWVTNTCLTILQQWNINRRIEAASAVSSRN